MCMNDQVVVTNIFKPIKATYRKKRFLHITIWTCKYDKWNMLEFILQLTYLKFEVFSCLTRDNPFPWCSQFVNISAVHLNFITFRTDQMLKITC
jgi:hypothetical protein